MLNVSILDTCYFLFLTLLKNSPSFIQRLPHLAQLNNLSSWKLNSIFKTRIPAGFASFYLNCVTLLPCTVFSQTTKAHLGVNAAVFSVSQCPKRILFIHWPVQIRPSRDSILSTVGWGAVTTRQRVMPIIIVPSKSEISGVGLTEVNQVRSNPS